LGEGNRYSIENYIFDPILIAALLLDEKAIIREDLGLTSNENYSEFKHLSDEQLQTISDFIINKVSEKLSPINNETIKVKFVMGKEIEIPLWYLHHEGHPLEEFLENFLKQTFGELKRFHQAGDIRKRITEKFIDDIPEFISSDVLEVFRQIQNH
jgi:hypothetical protein